MVARSVFEVAGRQVPCTVAAGSIATVAAGKTEAFECSAAENNICK